MGDYVDEGELNALKWLNARESYKLKDLLEKLGRDRILVLSDDEFIELRLHVEGAQDDAPDVIGAGPWFNPFRNPCMAGDLDAVIKVYGADTPEYAEVRLSKKGEARLVRMRDAMKKNAEHASPAPAADADCSDRDHVQRAGGPVRNEPNSNGYVEAPADPTAYVSVTDIVSDHTPPSELITPRDVGRIVEDYVTNRIRWSRPRDKRGRPIPNRRVIHLVDWYEYMKRLAGTNPDGSPRVSEEEVEERKEAIRLRK